RLRARRILSKEAGSRSTLRVGLWHKAVSLPLRDRLETLSRWFCVWTSWRKLRETPGAVSRQSKGVGRPQLFYDGVRIRHPFASSPIRCAHRLVKSEDKSESDGLPRSEG